MNIDSLKQIFSREARLKAAFRAIHSDMSAMDADSKALKTNVNEWIVHLDRENRHLKEEVVELKARLGRLQSFIERKDIDDLSLLRL